jgi:hypothetical protein
MTRPALRLVLEQGTHSDTRVVGWPTAESAGLHIHLHVDSRDPPNARATDMSPPATGGYDISVAYNEQRSDKPSEQHGYAIMYFTGTFA